MESNKRKNAARVALLVAALLLTSIAGLEIILSWNEEEVYLSLAVASIIATFSIARAYLFIVGQQMPLSTTFWKIKRSRTLMTKDEPDRFFEFTVKDRSLALLSAVALTIGFCYYLSNIKGTLIEFNDHHFNLFIIATMALLSVEWITGRQFAAITQEVEDRIREGLERIIEGLNEKVEELQAEVDTVRKNETEIVGQLRSNEIEVDNLLKKIDDMDLKIDELEKFSHVLDMIHEKEVFIIKNSIKHKVCPSCQGMVTIPNSATGEIRCDEVLPSGGICHTLVYTKASRKSVKS